jgi:hypothetical protein
MPAAGACELYQVQFEGRENLMNPTYGPYIAATNKMIVSLDGKIVGHIRSSAWGWSYYPSGRAKGGTLYRTIAEVKQSLLTEA